MAREQRNNVDYFPHPVKHGKKMSYMEKKYKNDGYATWFKILEELGDADFHFLDLSDEVQLMFLEGKCNVSKEILIDIIDDLVKLKEFDSLLWHENNIIFCNKYNKSIEDAYKKRKNDCVNKSSILLRFRSLGVLNDTQITNLKQKGYDKGGINPQRIGKDRIEEDSKEYSNREILLKSFEKEFLNSKWLEELLMSTNVKCKNIDKANGFLKSWLYDESLEEDNDKGLNRSWSDVKRHFKNLIIKSPELVNQFQIGNKSKKEEPEVKVSKEKENEIMLDIILTYFDQYIKNPAIKRRLTHFSYDVLIDIGITIASQQELKKYTKQADLFVIRDYQTSKTKYEVPKDITFPVDPKDKTAIYRAQPGFLLKVEQKTKELSLFHYIEGLREQDLHIKQFINEKLNK